MSDFDRNPRSPDYPNRVEARNWGSGSWLAGIVVAVLVIIALGYAFSDRWSTGSGMVEHRASATDTTTPPAAPATPAETPKP